MRQQLAQELLDDDAGTPQEVNRSLAELWWINRHLGGLSSWRQLLHAAQIAPATWLDVGSGRGELAALLAQMSGAQVVMLDRRTSHLGASGCRVAGDALQLPFTDASFDVVTCNLFLHHFHGDMARQLLAEMRRVARRAVLINDLERAWIPYWFIRLLAARFSRITRYDGPRSVRQAYTAAELDQLAQPWPHKVLRLSHYRVGLILWCNRDL